MKVQRAITAALMTLGFSLPAFPQMDVAAAPPARFTPPGFVWDAKLMAFVRTNERGESERYAQDVDL